MESGSEGDDNSSVIGGRSLSGDEDDSDEESSESGEEEEYILDLPCNILQKIKENNPDTTELIGNGSYERIQIMTDEEWEELGRDISNNTHLTNVFLYEGALNDHKMSFLFRGLTRSSSIKEMVFRDNQLSVEGVRSMVPFLQNANNITQLYLEGNNVQSEGFNVLFRALRDSPIEMLNCSYNGIESIEIDNDHIPRNVKSLPLYGNRINADGCRELAKLLQGENSTLTDLWLSNNKIDDEGVAILVDALQKNTSLDALGLAGNNDISKQGRIMLLKLVNDISSIKATLQSNHTLKYVSLNEIMDADDKIQTHIDMATEINSCHKINPKSAGREKVIQTQLHSVKRAELVDLQGINRSLFSEINPLHLPEVLSLIGRRHGVRDLFDALSLSIISLLSTVNRKKFIQQKKDYHATIIANLSAIIAEHRAKVEELDAELGVIEVAEGNEVNEEIEYRSNKRLRK
jgi:Ran GTPase-activating protein (RanGAP) involved in mRNA processing and transport